jgi:general secretion pathway protein G
MYNGITAMRVIRKGFTLIELLVAISIIAIISTVLLANFNAARERSRDAQRKSDLRNISTGLRIFYNDFGAYPANGTGGNAGKIVACGQTTLPGPFVCEWGSAWTSDGKTIMSTLPKDPLSSQSYAYAQVDLDNYTLTACLENASDEDGVAESGIDCASNVMYQVKP